MVAALQDCTSQAVVEAAKLLLTRGAEPELRNLESELPWQLAPEGPCGEKVAPPMLWLLQRRPAEMQKSADLT